MNRKALVFYCLLSGSLLYSQKVAPESSPVLLANRSGNLTVVVKSEGGAAVNNARIDLTSLKTGRTTLYGFTNPYGQLDMRNVPVGPYDINVTVGIQKVDYRVEVRPLGNDSASVIIPVIEEGFKDVGNKNSATVAQYQVPEGARNEYQKAIGDMQKGDLDRALVHLTKALKQFPDFAEGLTFRAMILMDRNDLQSAQSDLQRAIQIDPAYPRAYLVMGTSLNHQLRFEEARNTLERGIALDPSSWQGNYEMGKALAGAKDYVNAILYLDKAQSLLRESYPPLHLDRARTLVALKRYPESLEEMQLFLDKAPQDSRAADVRKMQERVQKILNR